MGEATFAEFVEPKAKFLWSLVAPAGKILVVIQAVGFDAMTVIFDRERRSRALDLHEFYEGIEEVIVHGDGVWICEF